MSHLSIFGLKNFRVFDDEEGFLEEFAPITLVTGANNSGKSSILKALVMLKDSINTKKVPFDIDLTTQEHLLGDLDNVLNNNINRALEVVLPFQFLGVKNLWIKLKYIISFDLNNYNAKLNGVEIYDKNDIICSFYYREANQDEIDEFDKNIKKNIEENEKKKEDYVNEFQAQGGEVSSLWWGGENYTPFLWYHFDEKLISYIEWKINIIKIRTYLSDLLNVYNIYLNRVSPKHNQKFINYFLGELDKYCTNNFPQIKASIFIRCFQNPLNPEIWRSFIDSITSLDEIHLGKEPIYDSDFEINDYGYTSPKEYIFFSSITKILETNLPWQDKDKKLPFMIFRKIFDYHWEELCKYFNNIYYLPSHKKENARIYQANENSVFINLLKDYSKIDESNLKFTNKYLQKFGIGKKINIEYIHKYQLVNTDIHDFNDNLINLVDFGYGIKQLVVLLVQISVLAQKNKRKEQKIIGDGDEYNYVYYVPSTLLVEEPESNLHPKWQSLLAEMFWEAYNEFNIQFIIETHSEYLIRRFQNLVAAGTAKADALKILYLRNKKDMPEGKKQVESIYFQEDGSIDYEAFDSGFFDEQDKLELSLLNIQRESKLKKLEDELDRYAKENDIQTYLDEADTLLGSDKSKILPDCLAWLATAKHKQKTFGNSYPDYGAIAVQCGRIVEAEMKRFFTVCQSQCSGAFNHNITPNPSIGWGFMINAQHVAKDKNGNPLLRWHQCLPNVKLGNLAMWDTLALLKCYPGITGHVGLTNNGYQVVQSQLVNEFTDVGLILETDFLDHLKFIIDKRDDSAHTYAAPVSYEDAQIIMQYTEEFIEKWVKNKK
jgi:AAA15 family ATPase/GTPase